MGEDIFDLVQIWLDDSVVTECYNVDDGGVCVYVLDDIVFVG
jgi:hypothetical protein